MVAHITTLSSKPDCMTAAIATGPVVDMRILALAVSALCAAAALYGCGPSRIESTYVVTSVVANEVCLRLVAGDGDRRTCGPFQQQVEQRHPLHAGDCIRLTVYPESSDHATVQVLPVRDCKR